MFVATVKDNAREMVAGIAPTADDAVAAARAWLQHAAEYRDAEITTHEVTDEAAARLCPGVSFVFLVD